MRQTATRHIMVRISHLRALIAILVIGHVVGFRAYAIANALHQLHLHAEHLDVMHRESLWAGQETEFIWSNRSLDFSEIRQRMNKVSSIRENEISQEHRAAVARIEELRSRPLAKALKLWGSAQAPNALYSPESGDSRVLKFDPTS